MFSTEKGLVLYLHFEFLFLVYIATKWYKFTNIYHLQMIATSTDVWSRVRIEDRDMQALFTHVSRHKSTI